LKEIIVIANSRSPTDQASFNRAIADVSAEHAI